MDASSLATGVAIEYDGAIIEDASWLRPVHADKHINLAELDAVLRGINLALHWKASVIHLRTDSACVHRWISDTLSGKARVRTKAASEMLIRRRLSTLQELAAEYRLTIDVALVKSQVNRADPLTRVLQRWLDALRKEAEPIEPVCAASMGEQDPAASESDHSDRGPGDTSEDDDVAESVPLRRSSRLKRPAPRCTLCDFQIREECEGNVPVHSKRARTCLACRAEVFVTRPT